MRIFLAMGLVWAGVQAQPLPALVAVSDMLEEDPHMGGSEYNLQPYLFPEGPLQQPQQYRQHLQPRQTQQQPTQPPQPQRARNQKIPTPKTFSNRPKPTPKTQETQEDALHVMPSKVLEDTQSKDSDRLHELDEKIKILKGQIKDLGGKPETKYEYAKDYLDKHFKHAKKGVRAKKAASYKIAKEKSGFFLGGGWGLGMIDESYNSQQAKSVALGIPQQQEMFKKLPKLSGAANMMNVELGYQQYFNPYFGTRIYGDLLFIPGFANYTTLNGDTASRGFGGFFYALGSLNMDMLFDAPLEKQKKHFIGAYAGFGVGLMMLKDKSYTAFRQVVQEGYTSPETLWRTLVQVDYTINLGVAFTYNRHLRFEVGTKIPLTYLRLGFETPATYKSKGNGQQLISEDTGFKRSSLLVMNVLYVF
ncbi:outer membrane beta-barrel protein [Helicobacter ailurogastricus]|uniref:outer membrane beta-barrel protein n=1 Tax=Helicobacter ailurogastricus TaxID=1578720 RepID=UPI002491CA01|nr:outer membrane beta-barrel protein [Helicobacter ailurogastricus]